MSEGTITVPGEVRFAPGWISWVGATTGCLQALGVECDAVEVTGLSGYAFHLCVARGLCPSGPTVFEWGSLLEGVHTLGRGTLVFRPTCYESPQKSKVVREAFRTAFELVRREIEAGRPCVIWGAYLPEFAAVYGVTETEYLVRSVKGCHGEPEPPVAWDGLEAPGGPYVLAFPCATAPPPRGETTGLRMSADWRALCLAVWRYRATSWGGDYRYGTEAYDLWIDELEGRRAMAGGNSYNAQCYAEGRRRAQQFLTRLAERNPGMAEPLARAADDYVTAAEAMERVAALFPFPQPWDAFVEDGAAIAEATEALRAARDAETRAIARIADLLQG